jgi:hypothetical protein
MPTIRQGTNRGRNSPRSRISSCRIEPRMMQMWIARTAERNSSDPISLPLVERG